MPRGKCEASRFLTALFYSTHLQLGRTCAGHTFFGMQVLSTSGNFNELYLMRLLLCHKSTCIKGAQTFKLFNRIHSMPVRHWNL